MKRKIKIISIFILIIFVILTWMPWLGNKAVHDKVLREKGRIDGSINKETGEVVCDYEVTIAPLGRWVASCEGGYYVTFFGRIF